MVEEYSTGQYGTGGGGVAGGYGGYPAYGVPPPGPPSYQQPSVPQPQQTQQPQGYPGTGGWNQPPPPPTAASQGIFKFLPMTYIVRPVRKRFLFPHPNDSFAVSYPNFSHSTTQSPP